MTDMIERVAMAMHKAYVEQIFPLDGLDGAKPAEKIWIESSTVQEEFNTFARAALKVLREPTEEMIETGYHFKEEPVDMIFEAMIDTALKEDL